MASENKNRKKRLTLLYLSFFLIACIMLTAVFVFLNLPKNELVKAEMDFTISQPLANAPIENRIPNLYIDGRDGKGHITADFDLFEKEYYNDLGDVTVSTSDDEKVVAPGTNNIYTLRIRNTGKAAMNYTIKAESFYTDNLRDIDTPVQIRVTHSATGYIVGTSTDMVSLKNMDFPVTTGVLGAGCYDEYKIEWEWPFEEGSNSTEITASDVSDTFLGTLATKEPVKMGVTFDVGAEANEDPDAEGGTRLPQTGDTTFSLWLAIAVASVIIMLLIIISRIFFKDESYEAHEN